jgi:hypothetical protein
VESIYCVLRTLNICDGQQTERPDRTLTRCLCESEELARSNGMPALAEMNRRARARLVDAATERSD